LINDIAPLESCAYLFEYDSLFGVFPQPVKQQENAICFGEKTVQFTHEPDLSKLDLRDIDLVFECTGIARTQDVARRGLDAGAARVLISGPSPAADATIVLGANEEQLADQLVISNASCTTNALAPLVKLLDQAFGLNAAHMSTIHCYTSSQPMVDAPRGPLARSRAGALSMVPTTTSATHLVTDVLPHLDGKITGAAVRVPTASVSCIDLTFSCDTATDEAAINAVIQGGDLVLFGSTDKPLVSTDLRMRSESFILATPETMSATAYQHRVFGWYDNEWGFSARMIDMALRMAP
jgi:glyceraldehyde 3-phosphate dehydrogenase